MSEQFLVEELRKGSEAAFKTIVNTYQDMIYNTCLSIVKNEEDAEDLAQEVFVQVYQSIKGFKGDSKLSTWLYRIAITKSLDHERKKKRKKRFGFVRSIFGEDAQVEINPPDFNHPGILYDKKEKAVILFKAIDRLPENQRIAFVLSKIEGLSYQEISDVMDTSISSIESLLHRAKNNLKKILEGKS
ncbi:MAG TPA: RNA polymerase sigma factor [Niabella sp.]|nr:RNA polymerase sigma factor [Niabella sp.]HOZ96156.1 RNA polymerase sigma factor [Niabella sp.]HQW13521.1 RNA polymerase sigma factor [Niabella sp.]HQX18915.1 RNA polymerase sigma factor [Niabella sp.]HRB07454.1 RNA polymerase sigma factor [Niabella sp.]